ncbi:MAG: resolvase [Bacillota bacterium]
MIIAVDPGSAKCGIAVVSSKKEVLRQEVILRADLKSRILTLREQYSLNKLVLGSGTTSSAIKLELVDCDLKIEVINEKNSTLEAKKLYWIANPPQGWKKLLPVSLQIPNKSIDDYAAVVLANRYLGD